MKQSEYQQLRILNYLERAAIFVCTGAIAFGSYLLWKNHEFNANVNLTLQRIEEQNARQDRVNTRQDIDIAEIKGQMVTWDTLKRIELFLMTHPEEKRGRILGEAFRMETQSRAQSYKE